MAKYSSQVGKLCVKKEYVMAVIAVTASVFYCRATAAAGVPDRENDYYQADAIVGHIGKEIII